MARDGHTELQYWHIRPAVANGQRVSAYRTVVGWVEAPWEHVHFSEMRDGVYVNPLRPGALGPFVDTTRPRVKQLGAALDGSARCPTRATRGTVELVVEAYDTTPIAVPGRWGGKPVTPALSALARDDRPAAAPYRAGGRRSTTGWSSPTNDAYRTQYARWTRQNKRNRSAATASSSPRPGTRGRSPTAATSSRSPPPT